MSLQYFPDVVRQAMTRTVFWHDEGGPVWMWALVHEDRTIGGWQGTWGQQLAINSQFITNGDPRRLTPIENSPPLAHSQRTP
jgi:hypothetical protein